MNLTKHQIPVGLVVACMSVLVLSSCMDVVEKVTLNKDGSGEVVFEIGVQRDWVTLVVPQLKSKMPASWRLVEDRDTPEKHLLVMAGHFNDISELSDDAMTYGFTSSRSGLFHKSYVVTLHQIKGFDLPIPYKVIFTVPGSIQEAAGGSIQGGQVEWNLTGAKAGSGWSLASSALAAPSPADFSAAVDRWFSRDALVFVKDGELLVAAPDGSDAARIGVQGVGVASVSANGALAYDRFAPTREQPQDLNIYLLDRLDGHPQRVTDDNKSITPSLSPDGRSLVYEKFEWAGGKTYSGKGTALWLYDVDTRSQRELVGADAKASGAANPEGSSKYVIMAWSADSSSLLFVHYDLTNTGRLAHRAYFLADLANRKVQPFNESPSPGVRSMPLFLGSDKALVSAGDPVHGFLAEQDLKTAQLRIIVDRVGVGSASLSPDGSVIAYLTYNGGSVKDLWTVRPDGTQLRKTASVLASDNRLRWSLDATSLLLHAGNQQHSSLLKVDVATGKQETLADGGSFGAWTTMPRLAAAWIWLIKGALLALGALAIAMIVLWTRRLIGVAHRSRSVRQAVRAATTPSSCQDCGGLLPVDAVFCGNCGRKLA